MSHTTISSIKSLVMFSKQALNFLLLCFKLYHLVVRVDDIGSLEKIPRIITVDRK